MTLYAVLLFLILSVALASSQTEKMKNGGDEGGRIDRRDPGNSFWYYDDPIDPYLSLEKEENENDDGLFDEDMSVEFIISVHDGSGTKEQSVSVSYEEDVASLSLGEWLMNVTNDCTLSLVTLDDIEVLPETPMIDLCKKGDKIIRLYSGDHQANTISNRVGKSREEDSKTKEDICKKNDEIVEKKEKGFFKKFKSVASKILIGGSSTQGDQEKSSTTHNGMFGSPLDENGVRFVEESCEYLCNPENQIEGLFRISGSSSAIKYFRPTMDSGRPPAFVPLEDAHNAASLLKMYLRELPQPIINLKKLNEPLSELEQRVITALLRVMRTIDANKELTRMDLPNIALVLGPNVIWDPENEGSFESSADSSQLLLQMAEDDASTKSTPKGKRVSEDEGYFIIPNEEVAGEEKNLADDEELSSTDLISSQTVDTNNNNNENKTATDEINELWAEIVRVREELEEERQERRQLADLILPQLEKTQLDLISALSSIKLTESQQIEQMNNEQEEMVKPKME